MALAPALRRRPALTCLHLSSNLFGDEGLAALVAPPPRAGAPPTTTAGLKKLKLLDLASTQVTDAGCAILAAALKSGALPALKKLLLSGIPASAAAQAAVCDARAALECDWKAYEYDIHGRSSGSPRPRPRHPHGRRRRPLPSLCPLTARAETRPLALPRHGAWQVFEGLPPPLRTQCSAVARHGPGSPFLPSLSSLSSYIITRVAPHCVNTLIRILHAAYDATNTLSLILLLGWHPTNTLSLSLSLFDSVVVLHLEFVSDFPPRLQFASHWSIRGHSVDAECRATQSCHPSRQPTWQNDRVSACNSKSVPSPVQIQCLRRRTGIHVCDGFRQADTAPGGDPLASSPRLVSAPRTLCLPTTRAGCGPRPFQDRHNPNLHPNLALLAAKDCM